jgi:SAM-dependent methyltransferase
MGLDLIHIEMLLSEHRYKSIQGELLTVSRNTIGMTGDAVKQLLEQTGTPIRPGARVELDRDTVHTYGSQELISDKSFFSLFSDARLSVLDVSDYEKADVIHDMSLPIDRALENKFDFVINGSCLDNIFNPVVAIQNAARMLKPGGRLFQFEWSNSHPTAYLKCSPDWFLDYFAVNQYADCKCYVLHFFDLEELAFITGKGCTGVDVYLYDPLVYADGQTGYQCSHINSFRPAMTVLVAEKGPNSTWDKSPIQMHYRYDPWHKETCLASAERFRASPRPVFSRNGRGPREFGSGDLSRFGTVKPVAAFRPGSPGG